jgi:hypothetical protein
MDDDKLAPILDEYISKMTSIRGLRVRRLITREYSEFDNIFIKKDKTLGNAIIGENRICKKTCITDGKGKYTKIEILNKESRKTDMRYFDMLHDSLKEIPAANAFPV